MGVVFRTENRFKILSGEKNLEIRWVVSSAHSVKEPDRFLSLTPKIGRERPGSELLIMPKEMVISRVSSKTSSTILDVVLHSPLFTSGMIPMPKICPLKINGQLMIK